MRSPRILDVGLPKDEFWAKQRDADDTATLYLGWRMYLLVVCSSAVAVFVTWMKELFRPPPLGQRRSPWGLRKIVHDWKDMRSFVERRSRILTILDWAFRAIGVGVAIGAIVTSADFIVEDRTWAQKSGWMTAGENGRLDEGDADSLGQTLPIFSCVLVFFVLVDESFNGEHHELSGMVMCANFCSRVKEVEDEEAWTGRKDCAASGRIWNGDECVGWAWQKQSRGRRAAASCLSSCFILMMFRITFGGLTID
jgi:hypothetical protein